MSLHKKQKLNDDEIIENLYSESTKLLAIQDELCIKLENVKFTSPIEYVYNPLNYAKELHETFIRKYFEKSTKKILFLGINPGPWGMCQTGIVFGEKEFVRDWLKITGSVKKPDKEHPKKKITGLDCHRREGSGKRFWGLFKTLCGSPENFFRHSFVYNLCPLAFVDVAGRNITPPEIKNKTTKKQLNDICDEALVKIVKEFCFEFVIGIGKFAEERAIKTLKSNKIPNLEVFCIPHPSCRNVKNSSDWEAKTLSILQEHGVIKYFSEE